MRGKKSNNKRIIYVFECGTESTRFAKGSRSKNCRKVCPVCKDAAMAFKIQRCLNCGKRVLASPRANNVKLCKECRKLSHYDLIAAGYSTVPFDEREDFSEFEEPEPLRCSNVFDFKDSFSVLLVNSGYIPRDVYLGKQAGI